MIPTALAYLILFALLALVLAIAFDDDDPRHP